MGTGGKFLRKLRARVEDRPTGFVWVVDHSLAGSGYPASRSQVQWLVRNGIRSILSLTEEPLPAEWFNGFDLTSGHVPMRDHEPPSIESLERGAEFIVQQVESGRAVAVHCLAGEGRTGCVLAAYLIKQRALSAAEAIRQLRAVKPQFVERAQVEAVSGYAASLKR